MADIKVKLTSGNDSIVLDKSNIENISSLSQLVSSPSDVSYSSLPNSGTIDISDKSGLILKKLEDFKLANVVVEIFSNSNDGNVESGKIQKHILTDSNYDVQEKRVSLSLSNDIEFLNSNIDDVYILNENGDKSLSKSSLYKLAKTLFKTLNFSDLDIEYMMSKNIIRGNNNSMSVAEYFQSIIIEYPYLKSDTARACIDKICSVAQVSFIADDSGRFCFVDNRPVFDANVKPIVISRSKMFSPLKYDPFSKKYIKSVGYTKNESSNEYGDIEKINLTLFQQTDNVRTVQLLEGDSVFDGFEHQQAFSGLLSDYEEIKSGSVYENSLSPSVSIIGFYPAFYRGGEEQGAQYCVYKIKVDKSKFITEGRDFKIGINVVDGNYLIKNFNPRKEIPEFLKNKQIRGYAPDFNVYVCPDEKSALATFGEVDENGNLYAISPSIFYSSMTNRVAVVEINENVYVYHCVRKYEKINTFVTDSNIPSNYTGDLDDIYLSFDMSLSLKKINTTSNIVNENADYELANNELMQTQTVFDGKDIFSVQEESIFADYNGGVLSGSVTVGCLDYYYESGEVAKSWKHGEILSVGDIIKIEGDTKLDGSQRCWKITGRKFIYDSEPIVELELVEAKKIKLYKPAGLYVYDSDEIIYTWDELINNGYVSLEDSNYGLVVVSANTAMLNGDLNIVKGVVIIGEASFLNQSLGTSNLTRVCIPETVEKLLSKCFANNDKLLSIEIPSSVNFIGDGSFSQCRSLKEIKFPYGITTISDSCCYGCWALEEITIPNSVIEIKKDAFGWCLGAKYIFIPDSVTSIENWAFAGIHSKKSIYIPNSVTTMTGMPFYSINNADFTIYCGANEKPSGWSNSWNHKDEEGNVYPVKWGYTRQQYEMETNNL